MTIELKIANNNLPLSLQKQRSNNKEELMNKTKER